MYTSFGMPAHCVRWGIRYSYLPFLRPSILTITVTTSVANAYLIALVLNQWLTRP